MQAERERERLRRKEMYLRHEERKRQFELEREQYKQRMIERRQREEALEIEREKRRLRSVMIYNHHPVQVFIHSC